MEVLISDAAFSQLVEEYMGPDARRYFDGLLEDNGRREYDRGYEDGYDDGYQDGWDDNEDE